MVKNEYADFSLPSSSRSSPDVPPGFPPQPLKTCTFAAAGISRNQNPTYIANGPIRQVRRQNQTPPHMKRSRPAVGPRRTGCPQKSKLISELVKLESVTRNINRVSPIHSTRLQEQTSSFISSLEITKDQSSLQANDEVAEHGSHYPSPHSLVGLKTYIRKKTGSTNFYERARSFGPSNQTSEGIDHKILQHVANALQYMVGSQTAVDDAKIISRSSNFNESPVHTLKAINKKHGDITRDCSLESDSMKALVLLGICKVVQDLQRKHLKDLDIDSLDSYYTAVRDAEKMKVNVQWLRSRLDEIKDACSLCDEAKGLIGERDTRVENIDRKEKELSVRRVDLERLKSEVGDIEEQLVWEVVMVEELNKKYISRMSKISRFQRANLMDGII